MRKWTILFLTVNVLLACGSSPVTNWRSVPVSTPVIHNPYFADPSADYVYKANIDVYGNAISGILVIKKKETAHRVVFTTEFGNKLIDLTLSSSDYTVNDIVDELNRKILIKTLVSDFRTLLHEQFQVSAEFDDNGPKVLQSHDGQRTCWIYVDPTTHFISNISAGKSKKPQIKISYLTENGIFADKVTIDHYDLKLKMQFTQLKP